MQPVVLFRRREGITGVVFAIVLSVVAGTQFVFYEDSGSAVFAHAMEYGFTSEQSPVSQFTMQQPYMVDRVHDSSNHVYGESGIVMKSENVDKNMMIEVIFGLVHRNQQKAVDLMMSVSDPESSMYGQYATFDYWKSHHAPTQAEVEKMISHLKESFPQREIEIANSGDLIRVKCAVREIESVYSTKLALYGNQQDIMNKEIRASSKINLPKNVEELVDFVNLSIPVLQLHKETTEVREIDMISETAGHMPQAENSSDVRKMVELSPEEIKKLQKVPRTMEEMRELHEMGSGEFVRKEDGRVVFEYPKNGLRRGLAPVIDPLTVKAGDGSISLSFVAYCQDGRVNTKGLDGEGICGNQRSRQIPRRGNLVRSLSRGVRRQNSMYTVSTVDIDSPARELMENMETVQSKYGMEDARDRMMHYPNEEEVQGHGMNYEQYQQMVRDKMNVQSEAMQYPGESDYVDRMGRQAYEDSRGMQYRRGNPDFQRVQSVHDMSYPSNQDHDFTSFPSRQEEQYNRVGEVTGVENDMHKFVVYPESYRQQGEGGEYGKVMRSVEGIMKEIPHSDVENMREMHSSWRRSVLNGSSITPKAFARYQQERYPEVARRYTQQLDSFPTNRPIVAESLFQYILRQQLPEVYGKYQREVGLPLIDAFTQKVMPVMVLPEQEPFEVYVEKILFPLHQSVQETIPAGIAELVSSEQMPILKKRIEIVGRLISQRRLVLPEMFVKYQERQFPDMAEMYEVEVQSIPLGQTMVPETMEDYIIRHVFPGVGKMHMKEMGLLPFQVQTVSVLPMIPHKIPVTLPMFLEKVMVFIVRKDSNGRHQSGIPEILEKQLTDMKRMHEQRGVPVVLSQHVPKVEGKSEMSGFSRIVGFEFLVMQPENSFSKVVEVPADPSVMTEERMPCQGRRCMQFKTVVGKIENYHRTWMSVRSRFADGSVSDFSPYAEIRPVFPLPRMTPGMLMKLYGIPENMMIKHSRNIVSVVDFLQRPYSRQDVMEFFRLTGVPKQSPPSFIRDIERGEVSMMETPDMRDMANEVDMSAQYIPSVATNVETLLWNVPNHKGKMYQEPLTHWLFEVNKMNDGEGPLIYTIGYGSDEASLGRAFLRRMNMEFLKMGLRGITVLVASGDDGASGYLTRKDKSKCQTANPQFPASLPWVTAVGGTQLAKNVARLCGMESEGSVLRCHFDEEKACMASTGGQITSGGGFSSIFARPWYQEEQVSHYLRNSDEDLPPQSFFKSSGRAYPDISANANNFVVMNKGKLELVHGTAASTPVLASMVAHWNEIRLQQGLPSLGFINPLLYKMNREHPDAFNDILVGNNRCGISSKECCRMGFAASRGWDAVTGLGTPKFDRISGLMTQLAHKQIMQEGPFNKDKVMKMFDASIMYPTGVLESVMQETSSSGVVMGGAIMLVVLGLIILVSIMVRKGVICRSMFSPTMLKRAGVSESTVFLSSKPDVVLPGNYNEMVVEA